MSVSESITYSNMKTRQVIEDEIRTFLIEELEIDEERIAPDAALKNDLGIDSLDIVDIVAFVQRSFGFRIQPQEMTGVKTLGAFHDFIENKLAQHAPQTVSSNNN